MSKINPNDAAFARPESEMAPGSAFNQVGLTKREYFAAMAMQGLLANSENMNETVQADAILSVKAADLLIAELNKEQK